MQNQRIKAAAIALCVLALITAAKINSAKTDTESKPKDIQLSSLGISVSNQDVEFNGAPSDIPAYNIKGSNYFKLRDLAKLFNGSTAQFSISADDKIHSICISKGNAYTERGDEMSGLSETALSIGESPWKLIVDGSELTASAYSIDGSNYYKIRDINNALGVDVEYNKEKNSIELSSEYDPVVPESAAADPSWFDDAAFCGDSLSTWLQNYAGDAGLGNAAFLTATSFGIVNALGPVTESSVHPSYQGSKMLLEDAIALKGAKKVYLMFGINDIDYGVDEAAKYYVELINKILAKSPEAQIYIESATPMLNTSKRATYKLNNETIRAFNEKMRYYCKEYKWNYLDIASVYADEFGGLKADACSDAETMGLHISFGATAKWVDYLRTHTR